jgi:hypothetical protein
VTFVRNFFAKGLCLAFFNSKIFSDYEVLFEDGVSILRFLRVVPEDEGEYSCEAENTSGRAVTKAFVKIAGKSLGLIG